MNHLRKALRTAAWKLTLRRMGVSATVAIGGGAGLWIVAVLVVGRSPRVFAALCVAAAAATIASFLRARVSVLMAARRVEQAAGWQERLSTAVELEASGSDSAFRGRLAAEVEELLKQASPASLLAWDLQRPAVAAAVLVVAAAAVTALFPRGLRLGGGPPGLSRERQAAARTLEEAAARLDALSGRHAELREIRAQIAGLLDDLRRNRPVGDLGADIRKVIRDVEGRRDGEPSLSARRAADELDKLSALKPLADALRHLDPDAVRRSAGDLARFLQDNPGRADRQIGDALGHAAETSRLPGLAEPMKQMAQAVVARDVPAFQTSAERLATNLAGERRNSEADAAKRDDARVELDVARQALLDSLAALGEGDGTQSPARTEFFVEGKPAGDNGTTPSTGMGNLVVRGKPGDLQDVYDGAKNIAVSLPLMPEVIEAAQSAAGEDGVGPAYREYVRRYFATDAPKR